MDTAYQKRRHRMGRASRITSRCPKEFPGIDKRQDASQTRSLVRPLQEAIFILRHYQRMDYVARWLERVLSCQARICLRTARNHFQYIPPCPLAPRAMKMGVGDPCAFSKE